MKALIVILPAIILLATVITIAVELAKQIGALA